MIVTRRSYNERCKWWSYDEDNPDMEILKNKKQPTGIFYAREAADTNANEIQDNGMVDIDLQTATIETQDDISKIKPKDIVYYDNQFWIVEPPITSQKYNKNTEYNKRPNRIYRLVLRNKGYGENITTSL